MYGAQFAMQQQQQRPQYAQQQQYTPAISGYSMPQTAGAYQQQPQYMQQVSYLFFIILSYCVLILPLSYA